MKKLQITIFTLLMFCGAMAVQVHAQDNPTLKALEEMTDRAKRAETERDSYKAQLTLKDEQVANLREALANAKEQANFWKLASQTGDKIDNNSRIVVDTLRSQVADDQIEITRLRAENDKLRSSRNWRTIFGAAAGFGLGYMVRK